MMTRKEGAVRQLSAQALSGDHRARNEFLRLCTQVDAAEDTMQVIEHLPERGKQVLSNLLKE